MGAEEGGGRRRVEGAERGEERVGGDGGNEQQATNFSLLSTEGCSGGGAGRRALCACAAAMLPTRNSTLSRFTRLTRRALFPFPLRTAAASRNSTTDATSASQPPLRVAVVGSGPAGMYVTTSLLKKLGEGVRVDVIVSHRKEER